MDRDGTRAYAREASRKWRRDHPGYYKCTRERSAKKWKAAYSRPDYQAKRFRKSILQLYGLTLDAFWQMLIQQSGRCDICSNPLIGKNEPMVDHHHATGKIRSLLCLKCNMGIGAFAESSERLNAARDYLERHA